VLKHLNDLIYSYRKGMPWGIFLYLLQQQTVVQHLNTVIYSYGRGMRCLILF